MRISFEELVTPSHKEPPTPEDVAKATSLLERALGRNAENGPTALVYNWDTLDPVIRSVFCFNGGDEDYLVTCRKEFETPPVWLDHMGDADVYILPEFVVYVVSHA